MAILFTFSPTSNHLHPLQVENCDSSSRLVVDEDDNVKSGLKGLTYDLNKTELGHSVHNSQEMLLLPQFLSDFHSVWFV